MDPCVNVGFMGFSPPFGNEIKDGIFNGNPIRLKLDWLHLYWPDLNGDLEKIELDGETIWDDGAPPPMVEIFDFEGGHSVTEFSAEDLVFHFDNAAEPFGYFVEASFEDFGCYISDGN